MAKHQEDLTSLKNRVYATGINSASKNGDLFVDKTNCNTLFATQQQLIDICMHAADLSVPTRKFETVKTWTYLLFEEFFL